MTSQDNKKESLDFDNNNNNNNNNVHQESSTSTVGTNYSSNATAKSSPRKVKFNRLWVRKKSSQLTSTKDKSLLKNSLVKLNCYKSSSDLTGPKDIEKDARKSVETEAKESLEIVEKIETKNSKESETFFDCICSIEKINAETQTTESLTRDVEILRKCEIVSTACGSDIPIEIFSSKISLGVQTDDESMEKRFTRPEMTRDKLRGSQSPNEPETSRINEGNLIYDEKGFSYRIEAAEKPMYVSTCESFHNSTDKSLSISHDTLDAAVGSSIIIDARGKSVSINTERSQEFTIDSKKSVSCEVCTNCKEIRRSRTLEKTLKSSQDECTDCWKKRKNHMEKDRRRQLSRSTFEKSSDLTDEDFTILTSIPESSNTRWRRNEDSRENSSRRRKFSGEKRSSNSRRNDSEIDESLIFHSDNDRMNNQRKGPIPIHESSRLSLASIENYQQRFDDHEEREICSKNAERKLSENSTQTRKNHRNEKREINVGTQNFDEITQRKQKPREKLDFETSQGEKGLKRKCEILEKYESILSRNRDESFTINLQKFKKPTSGINEHSNLLRNCCKISKINDFGKIYDWDRPIDRVSGRSMKNEIYSKERKSCKCGDACGGLKNRNKCCCCD